MSQHLPNIFTVNHFQFPYLYKFPGQATDERILYITREHPLILAFRQFFIVITSLFLFSTGYIITAMLGSFIGQSTVSLIQISATLVAIIFIIIGFWWTSVLWRKSIAVVTTKRLTKFVYITPWNHYNFSLALDMVVDTGAYDKGWLRAIIDLGTITARSSAVSSGVSTDDPSRINKKYFYIDNIAHAEDLHHYLHKLLFAFRQDWSKLESYRPFIPNLKGDVRKEFMKQYPEYWS